MERLTAKNKHGKPIIKDWPNYMEFDIINRLAAIEDILGDEYDLDELLELVQAKREGRCVVFAPGYPVASAYYKDEDGVFVRDVTGVVTEEEYKAALRREQE